MGVAGWRPSGDSVEWRAVRKCDVGLWVCGDTWASLFRRMARNRGIGHGCIFRSRDAAEVLRLRLVGQANRPMVG